MRQFHDGKVKNHPFEQITVPPELRVGTCFLGVFQGDVESVGTLSPAGSFHGSYATEPCPMAAQVVVKSTFLDVEEARSAAKCPGGSDAQTGCHFSGK